MASTYSTNLKPWGATGELWADGYAFDEQDPPYYEPQNRINYEVSRLLPAFAAEFNDRLDSDSRASNYAASPEAGHLTWRTDTKRLSVYDATNTVHKNLAFLSELESHENADNPHNVTLEEAQNNGDTIIGDVFVDNGGVYEDIDGTYYKYITAHYLDNNDVGDIAWEDEGTEVNADANRVNVIGPATVTSPSADRVRLDTRHAHDDRYYTQIEVDNLVEHGPDRPSFFETRTNDPSAPATGRCWMRVDLA